MRFYDFEKLYILSHGNPTVMLDYFKELPNKGEDFIVNPKALMGALQLTDQQKAEFLGICALRSYEYYRATKDPHLPIDMVPPWVSRQVIEEHPFVTKTENKYLLKNEG